MVGQLLGESLNVMSIDFVYDQGIRQVFFIRVVSSSVPSKLSSISRMKAARGREGVCLQPTSCQHLESSRPRPTEK
ncbi:hypothetical protein CesoFtcFv8_012650 [Champsocephalus esox]|uniref:Uncharacterized protein n=1 Tax=Champsocephalus esox TaxID=159716 RepID=A0AAN8GVC0_9TELE|nr:hypothetical protein CesoFtcFv8_012650 [Champsocephalus esox]